VCSSPVTSRCRRLDADPDLLAFAANERVVIVGPTNLLSLLVGWLHGPSTTDRVNAERIAQTRIHYSTEFEMSLNPSGDGQIARHCGRDYNAMLSPSKVDDPDCENMRSFGGAQRAKDLPNSRRSIDSRLR